MKLKGLFYEGRFLIPYTAHREQTLELVVEM